MRSTAKEPFDRATTPRVRSSSANAGMVHAPGEMSDPARPAVVAGAVSAAIEVSGLTKRFGQRTALADLDLVVPRRSAFGFLGRNGAGKTTLIRLLLGLTRPDEGSLRLLGSPLPERRGEALARVGAIVEEPRFHGYLTGRENLAVVAAAWGGGSHARIEAVLARAGLSARADDRVADYSLGMRQRLGVARALLPDPELLILDEPTNGLDPGGIHEFREMIRRLVEEGRTVFLSSHLLDEVEKICDHVAIVDRGRVVMQGSLTEVMRAGERTVVVATSDDARALALMSADGWSAEQAGEGIRLRVGADADPAGAAAAINRLLVSSGLDVCRLEPGASTLEQRFLALTERLENTT